jgi:hypothetical protein
LGAAVVAVTPATVTLDTWVVEVVATVAPCVTTVVDSGMVVEVLTTDVGDTSTLVVVDDSVLVVVDDAVDVVVQFSSSTTWVEDVTASPLVHVPCTVNTTVPVTPPGTVVVADVEPPPGTTAP